MDYLYKKKDEAVESGFYHLLKEIEKAPGAYIDKVSLENLVNFISGYSIAILLRDNYRLYFEIEFNAFVQDAYGKTRQRWDKLLLEKYTDREAFFEFFKLLDSYIELKEEQDKELSIGEQRLLGCSNEGGKTIITIRKDELLVFANRVMSLYYSDPPGRYQYDYNNELGIKVIV